MATQAITESVIHHSRDTPFEIVLSNRGNEPWTDTGPVTQSWTHAVQHITHLPEVIIIKFMRSF